MYIVPAVILFLVLVFFTRSMYYSMRTAPYKSDSQYPMAELLIAQSAPQKSFLADALQSSLGR